MGPSGPPPRAERPGRSRRLRSRHLKLCLLVLAPAYVLLLFLSATVFRPSLRRDLLRSPAELKNADRTTTPRRPAGASRRKETKSGMSRRRVVAIAFDAHATGTTEAATKLVGRRPNDDDGANRTLPSAAPPHVNVSEGDTVARDRNRADCAPMAGWQTTSFPTCNALHEMNVFSFSGSSTSFRLFRPSRGRGSDSQLRFRRFGEGVDGDEGTPASDAAGGAARLLGRGWFRHAWEVADASGVGLALKTLRPDREFLHEYYELHRRDAVAMERLTSSPYVMNVYGHCGQSVLTELAFAERGLQHLYRLASRLRDVNTPFALRSKLQIAAMTSLGLAHIHGVPADDDIDDDGGGGDEPRTRTRGATIAHCDVNPRNVIVSRSGKPKINDFNVAEFLTWDPETGTPCGFESRFHEPWWRAPEEMIAYNSTSGEIPEQGPRNTISEKADVYSLGNTLYVLLTGLEPWGKEHKRRRHASVSDLVARGVRPTFPEGYANATDPAVVAIREAIGLCWEPDPRDRPAAMEVTTFLYAALEELDKPPSTS